MVKVRFHTILKEESGLNNLEVDAENLSELLSKLPENVMQILEKYRNYLIILVNGHIVDPKHNIVLRREDIIDITIPVGGG
ncbi:MAG: MoaD/ThiS family protein [Ignisphaera sp.]